MFQPFKLVSDCSKLNIKINIPDETFSTLSLSFIYSPHHPSISKLDAMSTRYILPTIFLSWLLYAAQPVRAQQATSIFNKLTANEGEKMTLELDLTTLIAQKKTNDYFPAALITSDGEAFKVEVRPRGKYRRKNAYYPPLKLKFKKNDLVQAGFDTLNEIKLVLPSFDSKLGEELVIREYLAYRIFEHLSPASVKARLIRLTLKDTHVEKSKKTMYAVLVEDQEETCARMHGKEVEDYGIPADSLNSNQAALMVIFQYMIGNTDWEISMLRNVRLIRTNASTKILAMPYDFDFSGLVSAPYSSPSSDTGLKTVRDRFLMANGVDREALKRALESIKKAKPEIYDICRHKSLSREAISDMLHFLDTFFDSISESSEVPQMMRGPGLDKG